jgi:sec-independent protein translocase protein TatA
MPTFSLKSERKAEAKQIVNRNSVTRNAHVLLVSPSSKPFSLVCGQGWEFFARFRVLHSEAPQNQGEPMFEGLFQPMHLLVIAGIALLVFGPKKLPELGKGLGESIRGFKAAMAREEEKSTSANQD